MIYGQDSLVVQLHEVNIEVSLHTKDGFLFMMRS